MKKILFATTALVLTTGMAVADDGITIGGYGRFGLSYDSSRDDGDSDFNTSVVHARLRFDIKGIKTTDSGVVFGGQIRMQWDALNDRGQFNADDADLNQAVLNQAKLWVSYGGLTVSVGNVGGAFDDAALLYDSEVGFEATSYGDPIGDFFAYNTGASDRKKMGINVAYAVDNFAGEISYINPNQEYDDDSEAELAISGNYSFGAFKVSAAYATNAGGVEDEDNWFVGAAYGLNDTTTIGLNYVDGGDVGDFDNGSIITLYGKTMVGAFGVVAYVANIDNDDFDYDTSTSFGIGGTYDLGGATLYGSIERDYAVTEDDDAPTRASVGVKFNF
jgi:outer membrane protein OmpU